MASILLGHGDTRLTVSQAYSSKVTFEMSVYDIESSFIAELDLNDLVELSKWVTTQINTLKESSKPIE